MRSMIIELYQSGHSVKDIHSILTNEFGQHAYSLPSIYFWIRQAKSGRKDVQDEERTGRSIDE